jgi:osmotically inducible lipoprotein OsmB
MKKLLLTCFATLLVAGSLISCTNRELGTTGGAAVGGVAGYALTGGSALGTVAGAVGGGIIGNQVTK